MLPEGSKKISDNPSTPDRCEKVANGGCLYTSGIPSSRHSRGNASRVLCCISQYGGQRVREQTERIDFLKLERNVKVDLLKKWIGTQKGKYDFCDFIVFRFQHLSHQSNEIFYYKSMIPKYQNPKCSVNS